MKYLAILLAIMVLFVACGSDTTTEEKTDDGLPINDGEEPPAEDAVEEPVDPIMPPSTDENGVDTEGAQAALDDW